jgi:hypothetical protein
MAIINRERLGRPNTEKVLVRNEQVLLSARDFERFVEIMTADTEPTAVALEEAKEFRNGRIEGSKYYWSS